MRPEYGKLTRASGEEQSDPAGRSLVTRLAASPLNFVPRALELQREPAHSQKLLFIFKPVFLPIPLMTRSNLSFPPNEECKVDSKMQLIHSKAFNRFLTDKNIPDYK